MSGAEEQWRERIEQKVGALLNDTMFTITIGLAQCPGSSYYPDSETTQGYSYMFEQTRRRTGSTVVLEDTRSDVLDHFRERK